LILNGPSLWICTIVSSAIDAKCAMFAGNTAKSPSFRDQITDQ
jgi:hypothetical protein